MKYSQCARGASEVLRPLFRTAPLRRVCALLALWLVTVFGAPGQVRPYIGFVYPAGGQQGATFRVRLGGQALDGVQAVLVTGSGVRAKVAEFHRRLNNQEVQLLNEQLRELRRETMSNSTPATSMMAENPAMMPEAPAKTAATNENASAASKTEAAN